MKTVNYFTLPQSKNDPDIILQCFHVLLIQETEHYCDEYLTGKYSFWDEDPLFLHL